MSPTVIVGLSGGVDSAVAAHLLMKRGYSVRGVFLHLWSGKDRANNVINEKQCCSLEGYEDVRRVAYHLGVPLTIFNLSEEFGETVVREFVEEYQAGRTPNPCVTCNATMKFGLFWEKADRLFGNETLHATGHYARITEDDSGKHIERPRDANKDQTYFLHRLRRSQLDRMLFPLGELTKEEVRALAQEIKLPVASKQESQGVCFIKRDPADFLRSQHVTGISGPIKLAETGETIGEHRGLPFYTRGQRHGMQVGGGNPLYVIDLDTRENVLVVTSDPNHPDLSAVSVSVGKSSWLETRPNVGDSFLAQFRYRQIPVPVTISSIDADEFQLDLPAPIRAVMPGQSAVIYRGSRLWGGGRITNTLSQRTKPELVSTVSA